MDANAIRQQVRGVLSKVVILMLSDLFINAFIYLFIFLFFIFTPVFLPSSECPIQFKAVVLLLG